LRLLLLVPACAAVTVALLFACDGGVKALQTGMRVVERYPSQGAFLGNVSGVHAATWPLGELALFGALGVALLMARDRPALAERWLRAGALCLAAGAFALIPFRRRGYAHYGLLPLPMLVAGVALIGQGFWEILGRRFGELTRRLAPLLAIAALVRVAASSRLPFFSLSAPRAVPFEWPLGAAEEELKAIAPRVAAGSGALVIPPMHAGVHFILGTRALGFPKVYFWGDAGHGDALLAARDPSVRLVVVRPHFIWGSEWALCDACDCAAAVHELPSLGYRKITDTPEIVIYQR
jgi:hypothetical protein